MKPGEFFAKVYDKQKGNELIQEEIVNAISKQNAARSSTR